MNNNLSQQPPQLVLVVEDEPMLADLYVQKFKSSGYSVLHAPNGERALEILRSQPVNMVILDVILPKITGLEVLKQMRLDDKTKDIPVLVLTNLAETDERKTALEFGAREYLVKAMQTPEQVVEKVRSIIGGVDVNYIKTS